MAYIVGVLDAKHIVFENAGWLMALRLLTLMALSAASLHYAVPLAYYQYVKRRWLPKPWGIVTNDAYLPMVSIVIPTYNEAQFIEKKLTNLLENEYPIDLKEVLIVDSASKDGTPELAQKWSSEHIEAKVIRELSRKGKQAALYRAFEIVDPRSEVIIITDADAILEKSCIRNALRYFSDPVVGVVTASLMYTGDVHLENVYRNYYNIIRVGESRKHSTPIQSGVFQAIRARLIRELGLPTFPGSEDGAYASYMAFAGFRSLQVEDVLVQEPMRGSQFFIKIRRARNVIMNFLLTRSYAKHRKVYRKNEFDRIWAVESWINLFNPWLLLIAASVLLFQAIIQLDLLALLAILIGVLSLPFKPYRVWVLQQAYLVLGFVRILTSRTEAWKR